MLSIWFTLLSLYFNITLPPNEQTYHLWQDEVTEHASQYRYLSFRGWTPERETGPLHTRWLLTPAAVTWHSDWVKVRFLSAESPFLTQPKPPGWGLILQSIPFFNLKSLSKFGLLIWMMTFVAPPELQPVSLYLWTAVSSSPYCLVGFFILLTFLPVLTTNPNTLLTTMCVHFNAKYFVYISFNLHNNSLRLGTTLFPFYK